MQQEFDNNQFTYKVTVSGQTNTATGYYCLNLGENIFSQGTQNITNCSDCVISTSTISYNFILEDFDTFTIGGEGIGSNYTCSGATARYQRQ